MKKLFLALVCFAGVAFFASCGGGTETDKEPTVNIKADKAAIVDGEEVIFTIKANSNVNTKKALTKLHFILSNGEEILGDTTLVSNDGVTEIEKEITVEVVAGVDEATEIEAEVFVYDAADRYAVATTYVTVSPAEAELVEENVSWYKDGNAVATGLDKYGLEWKNNLAKDIYAVVKPVAGAKLYKFETSVYANATTETEKVAVFEGATDILQWKEFNAAGAATQNVNYVLGTKYNGKYYLINITKGVIVPYSESHPKTEVTLTGKAK